MSEPIDQDKAKIISALANDYYEQLMNEPEYINMTFDELGAACRDLATQDVETYIQKREAEAYKKGYLEGTMVGVVNISKDREKAKRLAKKIMKDHSRSEA